MKSLLLSMRGAAASLAVMLLLTGAAPAKTAFLGIQMQDLNDALLEALDLGDGTHGVLVADVVDDSAADKAGIERGDVILTIDGDAVESADSLRDRVADFDAGDKVEIQVFRDGKKKKIEVTLGEAPERDRLSDGPRVFEWRGDGPMEHTPDGNVFMFRTSRPQLGVRLEELGDKLGEYFGAKAGLLVLEVYDDSAAQKAGVEVGDVITSADGVELTEVQQLLDILDDREAGDEIRLDVVRDHKSKELTATVTEPEEVDYGRQMFRMMPHGDGDFEFFAPRRGMRMSPAPHMRGREDRDMREQLDRLQEELQHLREQVSELRKG